MRAYHFVSQSVVEEAEDFLLRLASETEKVFDGIYVEGVPFKL